jgi:hypothetical protein
MSNVESAVETGETRRGFIPWGNGTFKEVVFLDREGVAFTEGDIRLGQTKDVLQGAGGSQLIPKGMGLIGQEYRWPNGQVPYQFDSGFEGQAIIFAALKHWEEKTSLRFIPRTGGNANRYPNYLLFCDDGSCSSLVGMRGGKQPLSVTTWAQVGNAIHEVGHAIGLWHEQSRIDRDSFVEILFDNIKPDMRDQFAQRLLDGVDLGEYDFESVMHYPQWAFSMNGQDTIRPKPPHESKRLGQREGLSAGDIAAVKALYG